MIPYYPKSCPRCKGDMLESSDQFGCYTQCQQCAYLVDKVQQLTSKAPESKQFRRPIHMTKYRKLDIGSLRSELREALQR